MKRLVTNENKLKICADPLEFITEIGIEKDEGNEIIQELHAYLNAHKNVVAISAPQLGINKRIFCIRFNDVIKTFINPIITKKSGMRVCIETNISFPGKEFVIGRPTEVTAVYYTDEFKYEDNKFLDAAAALFDQYVQLLDGILPTELALVSDVETDGSLSDITDEEFKEICEMYQEFVSTKLTATKDAITEEETDAFNKIKFTEDVINGRAQVIEQDPPMNREQRRAAIKQAKKIKTKRG